MKSYEASRRFHSYRNLMPGALLLCCAFVAIVCEGCRSSRSMVVESQTAIRELETHRHISDSCASSEVVSTSQRDSTETLAEDKGTVIIDRDSSGRPVRIAWSRKTASLRIHEAAKDSVGTLRSLHEAQVSSIASRMDSVTKKEEKASHEVDSAAPVRILAGGVAAVAVIVLMYIIYLSLSDVVLPWIRKRLL